MCLQFNNNSCNGLVGYIGNIVTKYPHDTDSNTPNTIIYNINNNRYCFNIKRPHKSNRINFIVDVNKHQLYQTCFDTDCKHGIRPSMTLPHHLF